MNLQKYSERVRGFLQNAQTHALGEGHPQFTAEHVLKALLDDDQGMAASLITRAGNAGAPSPFAPPARGEGGGSRMRGRARRQPHMEQNPLAVMLGLVASICNALLLFTGSHPRHKAEDDAGAGSNPSPNPSPQGGGACGASPSDPNRPLIRSADLWCAGGSSRLSPSPCGRGGGGSSPKKSPTRKYFHPPPSHAPYPHLVPSSATPRGVAARWGRRWGKGDDVNLFLRGFEKRRPQKSRG